MMANVPTKKEMLSRISIHLQRRRDSDTVALLWRGYLAALMEWGFFEPHEYAELSDQLGDNGDEELREIFLGFPDEDERDGEGGDD